MGDHDDRESDDPEDPRAAVVEAACRWVDAEDAWEVELALRADAAKAGEAANAAQDALEAAVRTYRAAIAGGGDEMTEPGIGRVCHVDLDPGK